MYSGVTPQESPTQAIKDPVQRLPYRDELALIVVIGHDAILSRARPARMVGVVMSVEDVRSYAAPGEFI
jgi:hypothetical protein